MCIMYNKELFMEQFRQIQYKDVQRDENCA